MAQGKITSKQREILEYIRQAIEESGYPPSIRDICDAVHLKSTSTVHAHLAMLEKNGYIRRDPSKPRAIEITDRSFSPFHREYVNAPLIGTVAAGQPLLAFENIEDYFPIPTEYLPNEQIFLLKVKGDSMIDAGILNDDIVMVARQSTAQNGDIVVALINDSATVKTFFREKDCIRLQPQNSSMEPIIVKDNLTILGRVVGLLRFMR